MQQIADIRKDYKLQSLSENDTAENPFVQFEKWWADAIASNIDEVNAMTLATVNADGKPSARIVLLKGLKPNGFEFYTNYNSNKAQQIEANSNVALVFFWKELERQVRVEGIIEKVADEQSTSYFLSRPIASQIGAWASPQSSVIANRDILEQNVEKVQKQFSETAMQRPPHWGGYIVHPTSVEFWQGRRSRLHDRILYTLQGESWIKSRLAP
jgi:pyridoxamine 5'-phosphate oxidase